MSQLHNEARGEWSAAEAALIDRARALAPVLRERAATAEEMRRISDATHAEFRDAGFYRVFQPARYGGLEARYYSTARIRSEAAEHGLAMPNVEAPHVIVAGPNDVATAAQRLAGAGG